MSPDEEEKSEKDAPEAQDAPVAEAAAQPSTGAEAPVAEAEQPGTGAPAEQPSTEAEPPAVPAPAEQANAEVKQSAPAVAPVSSAAPPAAAAPAGRPPAPTGRSMGPAPRSERRSSGPPDRDRGGGRHFGRRKVCTFCVDKAKSIDYKDPSKLRRFVSDRGRIEGRRRTGVCAKHQRWLATALKRARHLALLPYTPEHIRSSGAFPSRR